jgi:hypothetical protein
VLVKGNKKMSKPIGRTFYFDRDLWAKLDDEAKRCLRSSTKQLEAILKTYYGVEDVELDKESLEMLEEIAPKKEKGIKVLPGTAEIGDDLKKRKRAS